MSRDTDDRDTQPPAVTPLVQYEPRLDISSLPPSVAKDVLLRLDAFDERLMMVAETNQQLLKGQNLLATTFAGITTGMEYERTKWSEALQRISSSLINLEANQSFMLHELKSVRLEQARQGEEIERLKDAFFELRREDEDLRRQSEALRSDLSALAERLEALSAQITAETKSRQNGDH